MNVIDADAHVEESPSMFESLDKEFYSLRPLPLGLSRDTVYGAMNACWLIDGEVYPKMSGNGAAPFSNPTLMESAKNKPVSIPAQELTDVKARLKDLDKLGIEEQVVYPTLFLRVATDNRKFEAALLRCYNDFISRACAKSEGRIHFAALVPTSDVAAAVEELRRARDLGAVATMLFGVNRDKTLDDRELYPLYEEAASLGLPVIIHLGYGCPAINKVFDFNNRFNSSVMPVLMGFRSLMSSEVLETFPKLRVGIFGSRRNVAALDDPATEKVGWACQRSRDLFTGRQGLYRVRGRRGPQPPGGLGGRGLHGHGLGLPSRGCIQGGEHGLLHHGPGRCTHEGQGEDSVQQSGQAL